MGKILVLQLMSRNENLGRRIYENEEAVLAAVSGSLLTITVGRVPVRAKKLWHRHIVRLLDIGVEHSRHQCLKTGGKGRSPSGRVHMLGTLLIYPTY